MSEAEGVYSESPSAQFYNALVCSAAQTLVDDAIQQQCKIRIVEVGAGTGATTASLLLLLSRSLQQYCFTDLSEVFLQRAWQRWHHQYPFMVRNPSCMWLVCSTCLRFCLGLQHFAIFDVQSSPALQGFSSHSFDAVIAVNVLHAVQNLYQALTNVHLLLRPSGLLILSEVTNTTHTAVVDATWGLTEGIQSTPRAP